MQRRLPIAATVVACDLVLLTSSTSARQARGGATRGPQGQPQPPRHGPSCTHVRRGVAAAFPHGRAQRRQPARTTHMNAQTESGRHEQDCLNLVDFLPDAPKMTVSLATAHRGSFNRCHIFVWKESVCVL